MDDVPGLDRAKLGRPGLQRYRSGQGFRYRSVRGKPIRSQSTLRRIQKLAIPPAWEEVWISPSPRDHIQAYGIDNQGNRQYIYHSRWSAARSTDKYRRMVRLVPQLRSIRMRVGSALNTSHETTELRAHALALALIDRYGLRVGGQQYLRQHGSRGALTLSIANLDDQQGNLTLRFRGKSKQLWSVPIDDQLVLAAIRDFARERTRGRLLLWREDPKRPWSRVTERGLNDYIQELAGAEFTAKDFRTLRATALCAYLLSQATHETPKPLSSRTEQRIIRETVKQVAQALHNTPSVVRASYIDSRVIELFVSGKLPHLTSHAASEAALTDLLSTQKVFE